jgi:hypothetical protein
VGVLTARGGKLEQSLRTGAVTGVVAREDALAAALHSRY